jgi:hypothetical protein
MKALVLQSLRWMALGYALVAAAPLAIGQQPGRNPFDGEWSLELSIATAPGGVSTSLAAPYNSLHVINSVRFKVPRDGTIRFLAHEAGKMHDDGVSPSSSFQNDFQLHLRGLGKAEPPPLAAGLERPGDRRLNLTQLSFILGNGRGSSRNTLGSGYSIGVSSADSAQMTFTSYPGGHVVTVAGVHEEHSWPELRSTSLTREEVAPDVLVETVVYKADRQGTRRALGQEIPVTERIEVKHVRNLKLVPRDNQP